MKRASAAMLACGDAAAQRNSAIRYRLFLLAPILALGACATPAQRGADRQLRHDLNSMDAEQRDILAAEQEAGRRCPSGKAERLPGKGGWTPEEYRCVPPR